MIKERIAELNRKEFSSKLEGFLFAMVIDSDYLNNKWTLCNLIEKHLSNKGIKEVSEFIESNENDMVMAMKRHEEE
jgi:hypothetical protein|tara:strand:+ start:511 stop:738 length:228 start_codon:yes stop_codon:yes gene_type:complete